ncbi:MAG: Rrf2 family transcriptional regulator [bacterium]|nr:Rrf2 family transcriptional regulator [bacterium]
MLEIGSKGEYATRAMVYLARRYGRHTTSLTAIADEQRIPRRYLEQLIAELRKAGLIAATRGASGGYTLAKDPAEISLYDIVSVLEGPLMVQDCVENGRNACVFADECAVREVWTDLHQVIYDKLKSVTLKQLADRANQIRKEQNAKYAIYSRYPSEMVN